MATKSAKKKLKKERLTRGKLIGKIDRLVSIYVRYGSAVKRNGKFYCTCVSCGKEFPIEKIDCGHFVARGCLPLRFDLRNVHPECLADNRFSPDHLVGYANWLVKSEGPNIISELLEVKSKWRNGDIKPYSMAELKDIYNLNLSRVRDLEKKWNIKLIPANRKEL